MPIEIAPIGAPFPNEQEAADYAAASVVPRVSETAIVTVLPYREMGTEGATGYRANIVV